MYHSPCQGRPRRTAVQACRTSCHAKPASPVRSEVGRSLGVGALAASAARPERSNNTRAGPQMVNFSDRSKARSISRRFSSRKPRTIVSPNVVSKWCTTERSSYRFPTQSSVTAGNSSLSSTTTAISMSDQRSPWPTREPTMATPSMRLSLPSRLARRLAVSSRSTGVNKDIYHHSIRPWHAHCGVALGCVLWRMWEVVANMPSGRRATRRGKDEQAKDPREFKERSLRRECGTFRGAHGRVARALGRGQTRWRGEGPEEAQRARQAACAQQDRTPPRPRHSLRGALAPGSVWYVRRSCSRCGNSHGDRARLGARGDDRRQRRDRKGRHLLPDDGQEAPAGAAGSRAESL